MATVNNPNDRLGDFPQAFIQLNRIELMNKPWIAEKPCHAIRLQSDGSCLDPRINLNLLRGFPPHE